MNNKKRIKVISTINANITIALEDLNFRKTWKSKGAINYIEFEKLEQIFYDEGAEYLFMNGMLYIDDMEAKIALGLEEEGTKEPTNVIVLTEDDMKKLLTVKPYHEFVAVVDKISPEVAVEFAQFAMNNELVSDMKKIDYLTAKSKVQIFQILLKEKEYKQRDSMQG